MDSVGPRENITARDLVLECGTEFRLMILELKKKNHILEKEKHELEIGDKLVKKRVALLSEELEKSKENLQDQCRLVKDLRQEVQCFRLELRKLREENSSLKAIIQWTKKRLDEIITKHTSLSNTVTKVEVDLRAQGEHGDRESRKKTFIKQEAEELNECKVLLDEFEKRLEEYEYDSPVNFSSLFSPPHAGTISSAPASDETLYKVNNLEINTEEHLEEADVRINDLGKERSLEVPVRITVSPTFEAHNDSANETQTESENRLRVSTPLTLLGVKPKSKGGRPLNCTRAASAERHRQMNIGLSAPATRTRSKSNEK